MTIIIEFPSLPRIKVEEKREKERMRGWRETFNEYHKLHCAGSANNMEFAQIHPFGTAFKCLTCGDAEIRD